MFLFCEIGGRICVMIQTASTNRGALALTVDNQAHDQASKAMRREMEALVDARLARAHRPGNRLGNARM